MKFNYKMKVGLKRKNNDNHLALLSKSFTTRVEELDYLRELVLRSGNFFISPESINLAEYDFTYSAQE
ncbi:MAG: hypothetical protein ACMG6E_01280 [Candidatus Roizmanbacteria bacterium]